MPELPFVHDILPEGGQTTGSAALAICLELQMAQVTRPVSSIREILHGPAPWCPLEKNSRQILVAEEKLQTQAR